MSFDGQVALVTGGARGIGQAVVWALARAGADVAFCDVCTEAEAAETLDGVREAGRKASFYRTDVADRSAIEKMFGQLLTEYGRLDILVNNAAANVRKPLIDLEVSDVEKVWSVALWGVFHCTQLAARHMVQRGSGAVVMISSVHADQPYADNTAYNAAKAAVNQMARTWAVELARHGVRVNIVEPGWTDTPGERKFYTDAQLSQYGAELPLGRLAHPSEIADAVRFLASRDAAYVTGSCLRVDGGMVLPRPR